MGSTLGTIRALLDDQLDFGTSDSGSNPSSTLLNKYINNAIRKVTRFDRPRELYTSTPVTMDIVANTNTSALPSTIMIPDKVYFTAQSGTIYEIIYKQLNQMISAVTPNQFFDTNYTGTPSFYDVKGTDLIFSKHFNRTESGAIRVNGVQPPTVLVNDSDITELPEDYDLLIVYEACVLFYQKDDDAQSLQTYVQLRKQERDNVRSALDTDNAGVVQMDPYIFTGFSNSTISNPNIFFQS